MTSEAPNAPVAEAITTAAHAPHTEAPAANPAGRVLRRLLTLSWLARALGAAVLVWGFLYAQAQVGDVGPWEPAVRGAIGLIVVIITSVWALAETWAARERRASRTRRGPKRR